MHSGPWAHMNTSPEKTWRGRFTTGKFYLDLARCELGIGAQFEIKLMSHRSARSQVLTRFHPICGNKTAARRPFMCEECVISPTPNTTHQLHKRCWFPLCNLDFFILSQPCHVPMHILPSTDEGTAAQVKVNMRFFPLLHDKLSSDWLWINVETMLPIQQQQLLRRHKAAASSVTDFI